MTHIDRRFDEERGKRESGKRTGMVRLLLVGAGLATLTTVVTAGAGAAAECPPGAPPGMRCWGTAPGSQAPPSRMPTGATPWRPYPPVFIPPGMSPPVTQAPATLPPTTLPPVTAPPTTLPPRPVAPEAVPDAARRMLDLANQERQRAGLRTLSSRDDVSAIALAHSHRMAVVGDIFHSKTYLSAAVKRQLNTALRGENVAYNSSIESAHARLMNSPGHRTNLLNPRFSVAGFAVVQAPDGRYFITQNFLQPAGPPGRPSPARTTSRSAATVARRSASAGPSQPAALQPAAPAPAMPASAAVVGAGAGRTGATVLATRPIAATAAVGPASRPGGSLVVPLGGLALLLLAGAVSTCWLVPRYWRFA